MKLCKFCNLSKNNYFEEGSPCFICNDALLSLDNIAKKIAEQLPASASSLSLSTTIPNEWLVREETLWDRSMERTICIKTAINIYLNNEIRKLSGKKPKYDADVLVYLTLPAGDLRFQWNDLFVFGRYKKLVSGLSQTRWVCSFCQGKGCEKCNSTGKFYHSVEEEIGEVLKEIAKAKEYTMHASGREDIDVKNEAGRPFVIQLKEAEIREPNLELAARKINEKKNVSVSDFKLTKRGVVELISASHFDKTYMAEVEFEREIDDNEIKKLLGLSEVLIKQKTPERVEHRRAFLERQRKILEVKLVSKNKKRAVFLITAEAGTYIKELIHGDNGRTKPSFSSLLGIKAQCIDLKVISIKDDFLNNVLL